ncbi:unnamed protein product [Mesocestoides corti]|uniref:Glutaredoxin domain-containing protein n=1 Tax=Mesocestoides corti TaxID=53468 RepID=A0A0R3U6W4_MESCO|nr:unnamed protein product [Mesocestoides corti]
MVQEFCKKIQVSSVPVVLFFLVCSQINYHCRSMGTWVFCDANNKVVGQVRGANAAELTKMIASLRGKQTASSDLNERIKALIHKAPIMLFMKGNPNEARCGFSRKMLEILRKNNIEFDFFDILSDDSIREGSEMAVNSCVLFYLVYLNISVGIKEYLSEREVIDFEYHSSISFGSVIRIRKKITKGSERSRYILNCLVGNMKSIIRCLSIIVGLKVYSDWPTYPQLYANGELIGGVDIVRQLAENNELRSALGL